MQLCLPGRFEKRLTGVFMFDGAPCHWAKFVLQWLEDCQVDFIHDWPNNSPDLNPIENLWSIINRRLQGKATSTISTLEAVVQEEWPYLGLKLLHKLAESVLSRLHECIKRKGRPVNCQKTSKFLKYFLHQLLPLFTSAGTPCIMQCTTGYVRSSWYGNNNYKQYTFIQYIQ